jgi:hypothetical protein
MALMMLACLVFGNLAKWAACVKAGHDQTPDPKEDVY